ncbi:nitrogen fixation protein NifR [Staphylococcus aureus]|nr:nitrogen fixation protein NifR [Staphylococcus aureus]
MGWGPQHRAHEKSAYDNVQVGVGQRNKFCENIISVPLPSQTTLYKA